MREALTLPLQVALPFRQPRAHVDRSPPGYLNGEIKRRAEATGIPKRTGHHSWHLRERRLHLNEARLEFAAAARLKN